MESINECKFCLEKDNPESMISPCNCKGSLEFVHSKCLNYYHKHYENKSDMCTICGYFYNYKEEYSFSNTSFILIKYILNSINVYYCIHNSFEHDFKYFIEIYIYLLFFRLIFFYNFFNKNKIKLFDWDYTLSKSNEKILSTYNRDFLIISNLFFIVYKFLVHSYILIDTSSKNTFKFLYFFVTCLHFINIIFFIIKKTTRKTIINKKI